MNRLVVLGLIVLAAGSGGFLAYRGFAPEPEPVAIAPRRSTPDTLPAFSLLNREGTIQSIHDWHGRSMIVNFWATWCEPCRREIPLLNEIHRTRSGEGFQIVGVAIDFREAVLEYAGEIGIDYPLLIGEQDALEAVQSFGIGAIGLPFTAFTDARGRIVTLHLGELTPPQAEVILGSVLRVNAGELTPATARTAIAEQLARLPAAPESPI